MIKFFKLHLSYCALFLMFIVVSNAPAQTGPGTTSLISHDEIWRYHPGTSPPQTDWKILDEDELDQSWDSGPGGFGYADGDDATVLTTMSNRFTTVYIRKAFLPPGDLEPNRSLRLRMDWDDAFIAWLDGVEVARSANAPVAAEPAFDAVSRPPEHKASAAGGTPVTYDLGPATARLGAGTHVFAVMGLNSASNSAGFSLIADLWIEGPQTVVGGTLTSNTTWSRSMGTILVVSNLTVATNVTLTMLPGTLAKVTNNVGIRAAAGGRIHIEGATDNPVTIGPMSTASVFRELSAVGPGAELIVRNADISGMQTTVYSNALGVVEDSFFHDYRISGTLFTQPLLLDHFAKPFVVRRSHFLNYYEVLLRNGIQTVEECLFEHMNGDALDFDAAQPGTTIRRCTFRHGNLDNVDAIDLGNGDLGGSQNVLIEDCLMYDFPFDKGVSLGDSGASHGTTIRHCLIYGCNSGLMAKDDCDMLAYNVTIADCNAAFTNYNKVNQSSPTGGGHTTNYNSIAWGNRVTIRMANGGTITNDHSDLEGAIYPGPGNINADPQFLNAAQRDYRLSASSACRGAGRNGEDMGTHFPVGAPMARSHPEFQSIARSGTDVVLRLWADPEHTYTVQGTPTLGSSWTKVADVSVPAPRPKLIEIHDPEGNQNRFYRIVTPSQ